MQNIFFDLSLPINIEIINSLNLTNQFNDHISIIHQLFGYEPINLGRYFNLNYYFFFNNEFFHITKNYRYHCPGRDYRDVYKLYYIKDEIRHSIAISSLPNQFDNLLHTLGSRARDL
jgi:hypothetical protein